VDYDTRITITDNACCLQDSAALMDTPQSFFDTTGITPAIRTDLNDAWQKNYTALEPYAYDLYVNSYSDEKHWLIVYTQPESPDPAFNDWYWESIQGDRTDLILTDDVTLAFTAALQKALTIRTNTVDQAIVQAFRAIEPMLMQP